MAKTYVATQTALDAEGVARLAADDALDARVDSEATARAAADAAITAHAQTGSYTLALADAGCVVEVDAAGASVVTVPPDATVAFPIGSVIEVARMGAGAVSVAAGAGVTIRSRSGLLTIGNQYGSAALRKRAADEWVLVGDLA